MIRFNALAAVASLGLVAFTAACTTADDGLHQHGPRGEPMRDSAMATPSANCPGQGDGAHPMPGPRGGTMPDAAHPGCTSPNAKDTQRSSN